MNKKKRFSFSVIPLALFFFAEFKSFSAWNFIKQYHDDLNAFYDHETSDEDFYV